VHEFRNNQLQSRLNIVNEDRTQNLSDSADDLGCVYFVFKRCGIHLDQFLAFHSLDFHGYLLDVFRLFVTVVFFNLFLSRINDFKVEVSLSISEKSVH